MYRPLPSQEELNEAFDYNQETGSLVWKSNGKQAGTVQHTGLRVCFKYNRYLAHRVIWMMMTGEDPGQLSIDHKNRDNKDNRWENLRLATQEQQNLNRGFRGYYKLPDGRFRVNLTRRFGTEEEAIAWRMNVLELTAGDFAPSTL